MMNNILVIFLFSTPVFSLLFWKHRKLNIENKEFKRMISSYARTPGYSLQQRMNELYEELIIWLLVSILSPAFILLATANTPQSWRIIICATIVITSLYFINKKIDRATRLADSTS